MPHERHCFIFIWDRYFPLAQFLVSSLHHVLKSSDASHFVWLKFENTVLLSTAVMFLILLGLRTRTWQHDEAGTVFVLVLGLLLWMSTVNDKWVRLFWDHYGFVWLPWMFWDNFKCRHFCSYPRVLSHFYLFYVFVEYVKTEVSHLNSENRIIMSQALNINLMQNSPMFLKLDFKLLFLWTDLIQDSFVTRIMCKALVHFSQE